MNLVDNLVYRATNKPHLNIFTLPYDGIYEKLFEQHNVYTHPVLSIKKWENPKRQPNQVFFKLKNNKIMLEEHVCLDCVIVHNRTSQLEIGNIIATIYQTPLFLVEHEKPPTKWLKKQLVEQIKDESHITVVYNTEELANIWQEEKSLIIDYEMQTAESLKMLWTQLFLEKGCYFEN